MFYTFDFNERLSVLKHIGFIGESDIIEYGAAFKTSLIYMDKIIPKN